MSLLVRQIATGATLQDGGRRGYRQFGVPVAGPFDRESHALANALLGLSPDAPCLEIPSPGAEFEALGPCQVALVGAMCECSCGRINSSFPLAAGEVLRIGGFKAGLRVYLACHGLSGPRMLGSVAGTQVSKGDIVGKSGPNLPPRTLAHTPSSLSNGPLRVIPIGDSVLQAAYEVSLDSNRVGLRLSPEQPESYTPEERPSEPSCPGAIQRIAGGHLLIHGPDGPTIGGYPKVAVVAQIDLDRLGQLAPLDTVRLQPIALDEARALSRTRSEDLDRMLQMLTVTAR